MQNIFVGGTDELLQTLAQREAMRLMAEDRARRDRLDQETRSDRDRQYQFQQDQLKSIDDDRTERREAATAASNIEDQKRFALQAAVDAYRNATTPEEKAKWRETLEMEHGIRFPAEQKKTGSWRTTVKDGKPVDVFMEEPEPGTELPHYEKPDKPATPEKPDARAKDDPTFPRGAKQWVDEMIGLGNPLGATLETITKGWAQQQAAHPNADLGKALEYVKKFYDSQDLSGTSLLKRGAPAAPAAPASGRASGAGPVGAPASGDLRSQAIAELQKAQKPVNEQTIALVMKALQGGD